MATLKQFSRKEIAERNTKKDSVFIIENLVYDVTKFLDDHPGGHEVLLNVAGKDASEDFDDVGHSVDAKEMMKKYIIGEVIDADKREYKKRKVTWNDSEVETTDSGFLNSWKLPLVLGLVMTVLYSYVFG